MFSLRIKALKDEARVLGLVLRCGHELQLDIMPDQAEAVRASIDSGDVELLSGGADFFALRDALPPEPTPVPVLVPTPKKGK